MNKTRTMVQTGFTKGFEEDMGGSTGQPANPHPDAQPNLPEQCPDTLADNPGQAPGHSSQLPQWMGQVVEILRTRQRTEGHYSATAIAAACGVNDATIRNRWFKALNSEIADERILKVEGKYTELAMELFAHIAHCRDYGLSPAEWVLQVLRPALAAMPAQREIEPNAYQTALAQREQDNDSRLRAMEIKWAEMKASM